jgi:hypothetical protein
LFPKFPLELRLKIWGFAAPNPCVVVQRESLKTNVRFRYIRDGGKVPGVLHACRESRNEFLEKDGADLTLARRRREHPVYKLYFHTRSARTSRPVFFSPDVDTFWPMDYVSSTLRRRSVYCYSGATDLDVAQEVKHMAIESQFNTWVNYPNWYAARFPKLESLTVLFPGSCLDPDTEMMVPIKYRPEVDGQMSLDGRLEADQPGISEFIFYLEALREAMKWPQSDWNLPRVKLRFRDQLIENEGVEIPEPAQDPLDDLE